VASREEPGGTSYYFNVRLAKQFDAVASLRRDARRRTTGARRNENQWGTADVPFRGV